MSNPTSSPRQKFDAKIYNAALAFYGLPANYKRVFTKTNAGLTACNPSNAAPVWLQMNQPAPNFPLKKASNADIVSVSNITLDFEYPPEPAKTHALAREFADWLVSAGLAESGLPIEDSGAGAHIVLPIPPITTSDFGGAELVNEAVALVVNEYLKPEFDRLAGEHGLAGKVKLEAFDISRVLSVPGTWRPTNPDKPDCDALKAGYMRRWLAPYDNELPERAESEQLAVLIKGVCFTLEADKAHAAKLAAQPPAANQRTGAVDPAGWLQNYTTRKQLTGDRSQDFYALVTACYLKFDEQTVVNNADLIDQLTGGKYGRRAGKEVERALNKARSIPKNERYEPVVRWELAKPELFEPLPPDHDPAAKEQLERIAVASSKSSSNSSSNATVATNQVINRKRLFHWTELDQLPNPTWLVEPELLRNSLAMLVGESGIGKTFVMLDYACRIALTENVVYIVGEGLSGYRKRVLAWRKANNAENLNLYLWDEVQVADSDDRAAFLAAIKDLNPALIVIDTLACASLGLEENSTKDMGYFLAGCKELKAVTGACVATVHHTTKAGTTYRGSSALRGAMDTLIAVAVEGDILKISCDKQKDAPEFEPRFVAMQPIDTEAGASLVPVFASSNSSVATGKATGNNKKVLEVLNLEIFEETGASYKQLLEALGWVTDGKRSELFKILSNLKKAKLISQAVKGEPYYITEAGKDAIGAGALLVSSNSSRQ